MDNEEIREVCKEFLDNSCRNQDKCDKIYDPWIESIIRSARSRQFKGFGLTGLRKRDEKLYELIVKVLDLQL